jgi:cyanate permease
VYRLDPAARNRITTVYMSLYFCGGALGSALSGPAYAAYGWTGACVIGAAMAGLALVVWAIGELRLPFVRMRHAAPASS